MDNAQMHFADLGFVVIDEPDATAGKLRVDRDFFAKFSPHPLFIRIDIVVVAHVLRRNMPANSHTAFPVQPLLSLSRPPGVLKYGRLLSSRLVLDRDLVVSIDCVPCGTSRPIMKTLSQVGYRQTICPHCQQVARPRITHAVEAGSQLAGSRLSDLGIPPYDIVRVASDATERVFLLAGDRSSAIHDDGSRR